jgi:hypothetical protein
MGRGGGCAGKLSAELRTEALSRLIRSSSLVHSFAAILLAAAGLAAALLFRAAGRLFSASRHRCKRKESQGQCGKRTTTNRFHDVFS